MNTVESKLNSIDVQEKELGTNLDSIRTLKIRDKIDKKNAIEEKEIIKNTNVNTKYLSDIIKTGVTTEGELKKIKIDTVSQLKQDNKNNEGGFEGEKTDQVEDILGKNAFTTMLKQISQLLAMLFNDFGSGFLSSGDSNEKIYIPPVGGDKVESNYSKVEIVKNEDIEKIYTKYPNYLDYRTHIQEESKKMGISELEVIRLLVKENNSADSSAYGPGEKTTIYGIGQMSADTWNLIEKEEFDGKKMDRHDAKTQISMAIGYMKYIKKLRKCSDSETKFYYNAGHNFDLSNDKVSRKYISGNLESIVYKHPEYKGKSVDYIYGKMTKKEYYKASIAYYDSTKYSDVA